MSLISVVPGQTVNTTVQLPQPAIAAVKWVVRDHLSKVVARGQYSPSGTLVVVNFVLPSTAAIPLDHSKYSITATDGASTVVEHFDVVSPEQLSTDHGTELAYMQGKNFTDIIRLPAVPEFLKAQVFLADGTELVQEMEVDTNSPIRSGQDYVFRFDYGDSLDTRTASTMGVGTVVWDYTMEDAVDSEQEMHPFYTVTPYSMDYINAIRKIVDKTRIGDTNVYLQITTSDLVHALIRGADFVMQSEPLMSGFPLDQMPRMLRDFIVKAAAVDLLRAQYLAEGMSVFDMQGLGVQVNVDRTQYIDALVQQLANDLQQLPGAKKKWLEQGAPLGGTIPPFKRPVGVLGLTTGVYSNWPMIPQPFRIITSSLYSFTRYGPII